MHEINDGTNGFIVKVSQQRSHIGYPMHMAKHDKATCKNLGTFDTGIWDCCSKGDPINYLTGDCYCWRIAPGQNKRILEIRSLCAACCSFASFVYMQTVEKGIV